MKWDAFGVVTVLALGTLLAAEVDDAWARARSGGSRGSRSFSAPARPSPTTPTSPSRSITQPASPTSPMAPQRPGLFGGLMGGLTGFMLGGLLGSLLFGGLGHGFGFGLMDLLLVGGGLFLLLSFLRRRRESAMRPAYATAGGPASAYDVGLDRERATAGAGVAVAPTAPEVSDLDRGVGHIRQMDLKFDPVRVADVARSVFHEVQARFTARDLAPIRDRLTPEMYAELQAQCDRLRSARRTNRVERIAVREAKITEAWQEGGQDYITVLIAVSLVDYTVDDATGAVVDGAKDAVQDVEEFWTFTRPVGPNAWKLSAIQGP